MTNIVFVCTGNTCRSPMAEVLAKYLFEKQGIALAVNSRGISVYSPASASSLAIEAVKEYGLDLSKHTAKQITLEDLEQSDIILTMSNQHKTMLKFMFPDYKKNNIYTLHEYADNLNKDIADPFGGSIHDYQSCMNELYAAIEVLAEKMNKEVSI